MALVVVSSLIDPEAAAFGLTDFDGEAPEDAFVYAELAAITALEIVIALPETTNSPVGSETISGFEF